MKTFKNKIYESDSEIEFDFECFENTEPNERCYGWYCNDMQLLYANLYNGNPIEGNLPPKPKQLAVYSPLYQQAFRWFRKRYKIYHKINLHDPDNGKSWRFQLDYIGGEIAYIHRSTKESYFNTYEEAELVCLKKLIEIVKGN